ncbi:MAG: dihydrolipoyl dehydrogenase [Alphaproteobacteria bacterium]
MAKSYDLVIIGGGPGGYNCAIRAAQLGMHVACVEKRGALGGTCLNIGCIPSKALLHASELYNEVSNGIAKLGVIATGVKLDLNAMMASKDSAVDQLTKGIRFLFKKHKIDEIIGEAKLTAPGRVAVALKDGSSEELLAKSIVIATGSEVMNVPGVEIDEKVVVSSTGALSLSKVPEHLLVVGGGYIGLEMGSVWRRLGAKVTVVEFLPRITPGLDSEVAKAFQRVLQKQGFEFKLGMKVTGVKRMATGVEATIEPAAGGAAETIACDVVLVSIGRRPYTNNLGLEAVGVKLDNRGRIVTDEHYRTNVGGIYAIGDVREGPMLAHKSEDEGVACAEIIAGKAGHVNYGVIPSVVYTTPEVASVGLTEDEVKAAGIAYKVGKFPFTANARARVNQTTEGFVKIIADAKTDRVLGVHAIGPDVGNMIGEAAIAMEFGASAEDIARTCHAHPTLAEAIRQAAMDVGGWTMQA